MISLEISAHRFFNYFRKSFGIVLGLLLFYSPVYAQSGISNPFVEIKGSVEGRTVILNAIGSSPDQLPLSYFWSQDEKNPQQLSFSSANDETVSVIIPEVNGEYFVNVTVSDTNGKSFRARRIISSDQDGIFINSLDHYPQWVNKMNLYEINPYSWNHGNGVFSNVTNDLNRLLDLGINTIWFTPIFESLGEGMGYWTYDYYEIHSNFGTKDDFKAFVDAAHEKGIRVILDLVINHTGTHHPFFQSCLSDKEQSPFADYYIWEGTPGESNFDFLYDWDQLPNLNVANPEVEEYLINVAEYWAINFDIDGFRADVAWGIEQRSDTFWKNFNKRLRNIKPEIFLLGEGAASSTPGKYDDTPSDEHDKSILFDDRFNSAYDWDLRGWNSDKGLPGLFNGDIRINDLHEILTEEYPERAIPLRFIENHDHPRAAASFDLDRSKLAHTLIFTVPGIPLLYCGGETGQTEQFWALGTDPGGVQDYFKKLIQTRNNFISNDAELVLIPNSNPDDIYSYATLSGENKIVVTMLNFTGSVRQTTIDLSSLADQDYESVLLRDVFNEDNYVISKSYLSLLPVSLGGYESKVYVFNPVDNLLINGSYNTGIYPWYMYVNELAAASSSISEGTVNIDINSPGTEGWNIQLIQGNLPIEAGEVYELSFEASATQSRVINISLSEDGNDYSGYFNKTIDITTERSTYQFSFTMNQNTDLAARFVVEMGGSDINAVFDNFKLRKKGALSGINELGDEDLNSLALDQNYPNPFENSTNISFHLDKGGETRLILYNINGVKIKELVNSNLNAGHHIVGINDMGLRDGVYFYELQFGDRVLRRKMLKL